MADLLNLLMLFGGCIYLVLGGDLLVRGSLAVAKRTSVSPVLMGLTVVALGTSAPELMVSVYAALTGFSGVAIGNVVGSNIANVLLVVGLPALIYPVISTDPSLRQQAWFMVGVSCLFVALCFLGPLGVAQGVLLLAVLVVGAWWTFTRPAGSDGADDDTEDELKRGLGLPNGALTMGVFVLLGCMMLPLGADLTVEGAVGFAHRFGVSDAVIGSTLVALGTSLPELSTTIIAAFHKSSDIALGNVLGSNVLNILLIMGVTASVAEIPVPEAFLAFDLWMMLAAAVLLTGFILARRPVGRVAGSLLLAAYVGYFVVVL